MVIVQVVRTTWTKASRGQPGAAARAAVPDGFCIDSLRGSAVASDLVVETVHLAEADRFEAVRSTESAPTLPARIANTRIERDGDLVRVTRLAETGSAWPNRTPAVVALRLEVGQWGRLLRNYRHSGYHGWSYEKTVVNVANVEGHDADPLLFVATEPHRERDEQESLF